MYENVVMVRFVHGILNDLLTESVYCCRNHNLRKLRGDGYFNRMFSRMQFIIMNCELFMQTIYLCLLT